MALYSPVVSEYCGGDINCYFPEKCCDLNTCCPDNSRDDRLFTYKLHVWNMWYFWFIIIFIMMSCFGGCGYYRRKRMAAISRIQQRDRMGVIPPATDYMNRPRSHHHSAVNVHPNFMVYTGPGLDRDSSYLPPPYSEVVSQPNMYPPNKTDLPPYPGAPIITADSSDAGNSSVTLNVQELHSQQIPQPPSYSEVLEQSNHRPGNSISTNQRSEPQTTNLSA
ncbi:hypothetical protein LOTGIDRAFT_163994 [Lottia gigantea]|uniref:WW domain binding protein VOPP1 n=1 Tax=Lottia gigantea TaxID=225164 RepID=V4BP47_LOTGI|nr:hypothetical protein LOTGIDRAFT_163994 [Lottia gigantea]ESO90719.1 hypothetical protein LOTGIDRAFT_163994 [Lottia gigantea]